MLFSGLGSRPDRVQKWMFESMIYADKQIICHDCGTAFTFTAKEQEQFASIGHVNAPKRCLPCRTKRKKATSKSNSFAAGGSGNTDNGTAPRKTFAVKCSSCGKDTMVPFTPDANRPVYCYDCFRKVKQTVKSESS
jgi:CxxC-x17-CxxC domain-containing protein